MTDLATISTLTRRPTQLPLSWYFDPTIAQIEQLPPLLFRRQFGASAFFETLNRVVPLLDLFANYLDGLGLI